jgi:hypothetical protein
MNVYMQSVIENNELTTNATHRLFENIAIALPELTRHHNSNLMKNQRGEEILHL